MSCSKVLVLYFLQSVFDQLVSLKQLEAKMLQVLTEEEHLDESRVAKSLGNLSNAFDEGIETYVCTYV